MISGDAGHCPVLPEQKRLSPCFFGTVSAQLRKSLDMCIKYIDKILTLTGAVAP
jgi:hypothetical protein